MEKRLERQPVTAFQQLEAMFCGDFGVLEKKIDVKFQGTSPYPTGRKWKRVFQPNSEDFMLVLRPGDQETRIRRLVQKIILCEKK